MSTPHEKRLTVEKQHRWRRKTRTLIDLRVCLMCKYAFISGKGANICLDCTDTEREKWKAEHPNAPFIETGRAVHHHTVRVRMVRQGYLCSAYRATINPAIPLPEQDKENFIFKENVRRTFSTLPNPVGQKVLGWRPYPLLKFEGFKTGRPQEKARILP